MPLGMEVGFDPGDTVLDGDPAPPSHRKGTAAPTFWPTVLAQLPISVTAKFLLPYFRMSSPISKIVCVKICILKNMGRCAVKYQKIDSVCSHHSFIRLSGCA